MCIGTGSEHYLSQEHLLKPPNYQQLASSVRSENQLASYLYSVGFILPGSRSTVGFIPRDFHVLISRQHSQSNRRGLYKLFLTSNLGVWQKSALQMPYLPHKTCCPDPVASAAAISNEVNCSWLHQSHHCDILECNNGPTLYRSIATEKPCWSKAYQLAINQ